MEVTLESLFSDPTAFRYASAERRFRTLSARRSVRIYFPVASTVKSVHSLTTTAALPSPKWPRSTRPAAESQSGTESARLLDGPPKHTSRAASKSPAKPARLLLPENDDFLIVFGNLIKEFFRVQILDIGCQQNFFQIERARAGHRGVILRAGSRESPDIVLDFYFLGQLLHFDFRRQLPGARADPLFRIVEAHSGVSHVGREPRLLILIAQPGIEQQSSRPGLVRQSFAQVRLQYKRLRSVPKFRVSDLRNLGVGIAVGEEIGQALFQLLGSCLHQIAAKFNGFGAFQVDFGFAFGRPVLGHAHRRLSGGYIVIGRPGGYCGFLDLASLHRQPVDVPIEPGHLAKG